MDPRSAPPPSRVPSPGALRHQIASLCPQTESLRLLTG